MELRFQFSLIIKKNSAGKRRFSLPAEIYSECIIHAGIPDYDAAQTGCDRVPHST